MNQIVNMVSSYIYSTGGRQKAPLVIRVVVGRGWGQGFQHSKSLHSYFAHIPGLKVVLPSTPRDAKGLLTAAIRDDNPVIVIEHRWLYWAMGEVPEEPYTVPIGEGNIIRKGKDITIVATSWMNVEALKAAEILERCGVSVEIADARTIAPWDDTLAVESVKKRGIASSRIMTGSTVVSEPKSPRGSPKNVSVGLNLLRSAWDLPIPRVRPSEFLKMSFIRMPRR